MEFFDMRGLPPAARWEVRTPETFPLHVSSQGPYSYKVTRPPLKFAKEL